MMRKPLVDRRHRGDIDDVESGGRCGDKFLLVGRRPVSTAYARSTRRTS
jgi:hypothetical protein